MLLDKTSSTLRFRHIAGIFNEGYVHMEYSKSQSMVSEKKSDHNFEIVIGFKYLDTDVLVVLLIPVGTWSTGYLHRALFVLSYFTSLLALKVLSTFIFSVYFLVYSSSFYPADSKLVTL